MTPALRGLSLALCTALFWGTLPIALKQVTAVLDPVTIVCLRFGTAALWLWALRLLRPRPEREARSGERADGGGGRGLARGAGLFLLAGLMLGGNFVLYNASVIYLSAPAAQVVSQAGPLLMMLGGVWLLREPFCRAQGLGGLILVVGFACFFNERLPELVRFGGGYGLGLALGLSGALVWAVYGVTQKALLKSFRPETTLRLIYTGVALGLAPFAHPGGAAALDWGGGLCLAYCCLNTIVAYGCFSRALAIWHTAGVGAVLSLTPLFALACAALAHRLVPGFFPAAPLNLLGHFGALLVMLGAGLLAAGPKLRPALRRR